MSHAPRRKAGRIVGIGSLVWPDEEPQREGEGQCDCCGKVFPIEQLRTIRYDHPNSNVPCDTMACPKCCGDDEEE